MKKTVIILAGITALIVGAATYYIVAQYNKLKNVCVSFLISKTKINFLGSQKTDITLFFEINNKSNVSATVSGYEFDVYINAVKISTAYSTSLIELMPKGSSIVVVNVVFNPMQVLQIGLQNIGDILALDKSKMEIEIVGRLIGIKSSIINISSIPLSFKTNIAEITNSPDDTTC